MAVSYFPNPILLKTGILQNSMTRYPLTFFFKVSFGTLLVRPLFLTSLYILSINVKVLVSFTCKNNFVVCDASIQGLTKRFDKSETMKLYRIQFSWKIDFAKYPVVIDSLRHKSQHF